MIRIVQCWDDGVEDDIRLCELLREKGAKASFNLNAGLHAARRSGTWRYKGSKDVLRLAKSELLSVYDGFTIANHSLTHPWPARIPLQQWESEVLDGRKQLQDLFSAPVSGFAYPFGEVNPAVADIVREADHVYARTCENTTPCFPPTEPLRFAADCHYAAMDFRERYQHAKSVNSSVFYFWGHSYEFLTEADWQDFSGKLDLFNMDPDAVWCDLPDLFQ